MKGWPNRLKSSFQPGSKLRPIGFAVASLALGAVLSAGLFATGPSPAVEALTEKSWPVTTIAVRQETLAPGFTAFGRVESRHRAELAAELEARVAQVHVREGDRVARGDLLVALENDELQLNLAAARAQRAARAAEMETLALELSHLQRVDPQHRARLQAAEAKLARHGTLREQRLISDGFYDDVLQQVSADQIRYQDHAQRLANLPHRLAAAQAALDEAMANAERAAVIARRAQIVAPFDAVVLSVDAAVGATTSRFAPLVVLADRDSYQIRVPVPPAHRRAFLDAALQGAGAAPGIRGAIETSTASPITARFSHLAGTVQGGQASSEALFRLDEASDSRLLALPLGSTVELAVSLPPVAQAIALPPEAVYENARVWRVVDERLQPVAVQQLGTWHDTSGASPQVLVRSAQLQPGEQVIVTQLPNPISGLKVIATPRPAAEPEASQFAEPEPNATPLPTPAGATSTAALVHEIARQHRSQFRHGKPKPSAETARAVPAAPILLLPASTATKPSAQPRAAAKEKPRVSSRRFRMS